MPSREAVISVDPGIMSGTPVFRGSAYRCRRCWTAVVGLRLAVTDGATVLCDGFVPPST